MTLTAHFNMLVSPDLRADLVDYADQQGLSLSEVGRLALWRLLNSPEEYIAPTLPDWQVEAWTSLLRGLFGKEHLVLTDDIKPLLRQAVAALDKRDWQVLRLRFGLDGRRYTLAEVGAVLGVNRQRAHQVEARALRRLRGWLRKREIWEMLEEQIETLSKEGA